MKLSVGTLGLLAGHAKTWWLYVNYQGSHRRIHALAGNPGVRYRC